MQDLLGHGTFGQVFKCLASHGAGNSYGSSGGLKPAGAGAAPAAPSAGGVAHGEVVAVKVIKNQAAYYHQVQAEADGCPAAAQWRRGSEAMPGCSVQKWLLPWPLCLCVHVLICHSQRSSQARVEIGVLQLLNTRADPEDAHHIVRMKVRRRQPCHQGSCCRCRHALAMRQFVRPGSVHSGAHAMTGTARHCCVLLLLPQT